MRYLLYLPKPETITDDDCVQVERLMERLRKEQALAIERVPARFTLHKVPENCWKYRVNIDQSANLAKIKQLRKRIQDACMDVQEKEALKKCFCLYGENGQVMDCSWYIWITEQAQKSAAFEYKETDTSIISELLAA